MEKEAGLEAEKKELQLKKDAVSEQIAATQRAHDKLKVALETDDKHLELMRIEERMRPFKQVHVL